MRIHRTISVSSLPWAQTDGVRFLTTTGSPTATYAVERSRLPAPGPGCVLQKVQIVGGMYITGGAEFALGKRDKPVRMTRKGYVPLLQAISRKFVLFWDEEGKRGWLSNGLSALLHLLRGSLEQDRTGKFSAAFKMALDDLHEAGGAYCPASAAEFLIDEHNKAVNLFPERDGTFYRLQDRVEYLCNILEKLVDQQEDVDRPTGVSLQFRPRARLEGWDYRDIVSMKDPLFPKVATLGASGKGWVDFTRALRVVTIFGRGFGELIEPRTSPGTQPSCARWITLPTDQYYLAVHVADLQEIMDSEGDSESRPVRLCQNIFWYRSGQPLRPCACGLGSNRHDPVQALFPSTLKIFARHRNREPAQLTPNGAVVFGHSRKIGWYYNDFGNPVPGDTGPEGVPLLPPLLSAAASSSSTGGTDTESPQSQGSDDGGSSPASVDPLPSTPPSTLGTSVSTDSGSDGPVVSAKTGGRSKWWGVIPFVSTFSKSSARGAVTNRSVGS